jgi:uncharacterized membrane protein YraQ (UPF0718 family)
MALPWGIFAACRCARLPVVAEHQLARMGVEVELVFQVRLVVEAHIV